MSSYGYLEVFQNPLDFEITRVDYILTVGKVSLLFFTHLRGPSVQNVYVFTVLKIIVHYRYTE